MKISDFSERVQGFYAEYTEENDGDFSVNFKKGEWFWAKITPLPFPVNTAKDEGTFKQNRYEVVMLKIYNCHTRHAYLRRLRWNHKLLDIYTPWLENENKTCISGLAKERIEEEHYG